MKAVGQVRPELNADTATWPLMPFLQGHCGCSCNVRVGMSCKILGCGGDTFA